jgi:hypothetical protein
VRRASSTTTLAALVVAVAASAACSRPSEPDPELRELLELLRAQQGAQTTGPASTAPTAPPRPAFDLTGGLGPDGQPLPPPGPDTYPPVAPPDVESPLPNYSSLLVARPEGVESVLPESSSVPLVGTAWSGEAGRFPFLGENVVPAGALIAFRPNDVLVMAAGTSLSFRVDYAPGDLLCRGMRPCVAVVDESNRIFPIFYEITDGTTPLDPQRFHVLECVSRENVEGGEFPSDELLRENGGLEARHRTERWLCARRLDAPSLTRVALGVDPPSFPIDP